MKKMIDFIRVATLLGLVLAITLSANLYAAPGVTLDWGTSYQTIDGFGVSEAFHQSNNIALLGETKQKEIYDLLFSTSKGAGFSIFRSILGDGGTWGNATDGPNKTMQPSATTWDWKESNDDQIPMIRDIQSLYGIKNILYTAWSPPAWMKSNGSVSRGSLSTDKYAAYATYLAEHIKNYQSKFGIEITHIGLANEPDLETDYSSCTWSSAQFKTFMKDHLAPTFDREGITAKVIVGEPMRCTESLAIDSLNDSTAVKRTDIVGCHNYGSTYVAFPTTKSKGKGIWQTEISNLNGNDPSITDGLRWSKEVHDFMTVTQGNAWCYWWGACYKTNVGEGLIRMNMNSKTYTVDKRLYTIGQFARFVRPGWQRFSASANPVSGVYVTAYKDPATGDFAIVALNNGSSGQSITYTLKGFAPGSVTPYTTSATQNLAAGSAISVSGSSFTHNLAANSITTFVGNSDSPLPTPTPTSTSTSTATPTLMPTPTPTAEVTPTPDTGCVISYSQNDWGSGATVSVAIKNNGASAINGWTLAWSFPGNQKITNLWNGSYTQSGASVSVRNASYNSTIPADGSVTFGFNLSYSGANPKPDGFTLNGTPCLVQ
jgi:glucuronoarabinoxylan endo-1,4-beta-xylanase